MLPVKASPPGVSRCRREVSCFPPRSPLDTSHAACLSAQARPRAFYGAVIQGWLENSCGDLHHHLCVCVCVSACSPATSLNLGKCHQQVNGNVLFPCCWDCYPLLLHSLVCCRGFKRWSVSHDEVTGKTRCAQHKARTTWTRNPNETTASTLSLLSAVCPMGVKV